MHENDFDSFNLVAGFRNLWDKKDFSLPDSIQSATQRGRLLKSAKLTDLLRFRPYLIDCHFIIRENVRNLFGEFVLPEHYFIPVEMFSNEGRVIELCYLFYMPDLSFDVIDFRNSIFYAGGIVTEKKVIQIANKEEYVEHISKSPTIGRDKIVLSDEFDTNLDFFSTRLGDMFISKKMKQRFFSESLTGLKVFDEQYLLCESIS